MIDKTNIRIIAGSGGNGCVSFRREKYIPKGGPDGGDGGRGGNIFIKGDSSLSTLTYLTSHSIWKAPRGTHGKGKKQHGAAGDDIFIRVPIGTVIEKDSSNSGSTELLDITSDVPVMVAKGGRGGMGNTRFASSTNQEPILAQTGEQGEDTTLFLELKLLADVGILGKPNAGKSTLISHCSRARPKVASYPFTTTEPVLAVVERQYKTFLIMEIPGLVKEAHRGVGLGHEFLRHAERARVYIHLVDGLSDHIQEDMDMINSELFSYGKGLISKPQIVVINKIDIPEVAKKTDKVGLSLRQGFHGPLFISAATGEGMEALIMKIIEMLEYAPRGGGEDISETKPVWVNEAPSNVRQESFDVQLVDGVYQIWAPKLERLIPMVDLRDRRALAQVWKEVHKMGIAAKLEDMGIGDGQTVKIGDVELEWF